MGGSSQTLQPPRPQMRMVQPSAPKVNIGGRTLPADKVYFRGGQAYAQPSGKTRSERSPRYEKLGVTAQEAGYFGPGRYGAAKMYGQTEAPTPIFGDFHQAHKTPKPIAVPVSQYIKDTKKVTPKRNKPKRTAVMRKTSNFR